MQNREWTCSRLDPGQFREEWSTFSLMGSLVLLRDFRKLLFDLALAVSLPLFAQQFGVVLKGVEIHLSLSFPTEERNRHEKQRPVCHLWRPAPMITCRNPCAKVRAAWHGVCGPSHSRQLRP